MDIRCEFTDMVDVGALVPDPRNANMHDDRQISILAKNIKHQGFRHPIIVSKLNNKIAAGHGRLMAAQKLGMTQVPVDYQDFESEADQFRFMIADNKISSLATHDDNLMIEGIKGLELIDSDFELLGLDDFLLPLDPDAAKDEIEDDIPTDVETRCKLGDLWLLGEHRLVCGDSTDILQVERLMDGQKADMVFTDPPYGISYDDRKHKPVGKFKASSFGPIIGDDKKFAFSDFAWLKQEDQVWFGANYYCQDLPEGGSWYVWDKKSPAMQGNKMLFTSDFELAFSKKKRKQETARVLWAGAINKEKGEQRLHPTQKPIGLVEWFFERIKAESVLDLFGGSGSTLIACEKTNRKCYMMELDEKYCDVILTRWEKYSGKTATRET